MQKSQSKNMIRIYLAKNRISELDQGLFHEKSSISPELPKSHFLGLKQFKEVTLAPGFGMDRHFDEDMLLMLIPVVGELQFTGGNLKANLLPGQVWACQIPASSEFQLANPNNLEANHFIQLALVYDQAAGSSLLTFDLEGHRNDCVSLDNVAPATAAHRLNLKLGLFDGRIEKTYKYKKDRNLFVYCVEGAFEVQNCLLLKSDGLAIEQAEILDFEALSDNAMILCLEF